MASRRMPRLMAWVARVWRSWWGWTSPMPAWRPMGATMRCTVRRSIGAWSSAIRRRWVADVVGVGGGPVGEQRRRGRGAAG